MAIKKYTLSEQDFETLKEAVAESISIYTSRGNAAQPQQALGIDDQPDEAPKPDVVQISMALATLSLLHSVKNSMRNIDAVIRATSNYPVQFAISEAAGEYDSYILAYDDSTSSMGYNALLAISNACVQYKQPLASQRLLYKILDEAE